MTKMVISLMAVALLSACGSDSKSNSGNSSEDKGLQGIWVSDDEFRQYVNFQSNGRPLTYSYDHELNCYASYEQPKIVADNQIQLNLIDLKGTFNYSYIDQDTLQLSENGKEVIRLKRSDTSAINFSNDCGDSTDSSVLKAKIQFSSLPEEILVNREETEDRHGEYSVGVVFDVNNSGEVDKGDLSFYLSHFKQVGANPESKPLDELKVVIDRQSSETSRYGITPVAVSINENSIEFIAPVSLHADLKGISNGTQVLVQAHHWAVEGSTKWDCYPDDCQFTEGVDTSSTLWDSVEEATSKDSIVDIIAVEVLLLD